MGASNSNVRNFILFSHLLLIALVSAESEAEAESEPQFTHYDLSSYRASLNPNRQSLDDVFLLKIALDKRTNGLVISGVPTKTAAASVPYSAHTINNNNNNLLQQRLKNYLASKRRIDQYSAPTAAKPAISRVKQQLQPKQQQQQQPQQARRTPSLYPRQQSRYSSLNQVVYRPRYPTSYRRTSFPVAPRRRSGRRDSCPLLNFYLKKYASGLGNLSSKLRRGYRRTFRRRRNDVGRAQRVYSRQIQRQSLAHITRNAEHQRQLRLLAQLQRLSQTPPFNVQQVQSRTPLLSSSLYANHQQQQPQLPTFRNVPLT